MRQPASNVAASSGAASVGALSGLSLASGTAVTSSVASVTSGWPESAPGAASGCWSSVASSCCPASDGVTPEPAPPQSVTNTAAAIVKAKARKVDRGARQMRPILGEDITLRLALGCRLTKRRKSPPIPGSSLRPSLPGRPRERRALNPGPCRLRPRSAGLGDAAPRSR